MPTHASLNVNNHYGMRLWYFLITCVHVKKPDYAFHYEFHALTDISTAITPL